MVEPVHIFAPFVPHTFNNVNMKKVLSFSAWERFRGFHLYTKPNRNNWQNNKMWLYLHSNWVCTLYICSHSHRTIGSNVESDMVCFDFEVRVPTKGRPQSITDRKERNTSDASGLYNNFWLNPRQSICSISHHRISYIRNFLTVNFWF